MKSLGRLSIGWMNGEWHALMIHDDGRVASGTKSSSYATATSGKTIEAALANLVREIARAAFRVSRNVDYDTSGPCPTMVEYYAEAEAMLRCGWWPS